MAAPVAHPTSTTTRDGAKRKVRPSHDPIIAPSTTTGPSFPAEPPQPIVIALAAVRASAGLGSMSPAAPDDRKLHVGDVHSFMSAADVAHHPPRDGETGRGYHGPIREQRKAREFRRRETVENPVREIDALVERDDAECAQKPRDDGEDEQNCVLAQRLAIEPRRDRGPRALDCEMGSFREDYGRAARSLGHDPQCNTRNKHSHYTPRVP